MPGMLPGLSYGGRSLAAEYREFYRPAPIERAAPVAPVVTRAPEPALEGLRRVEGGWAILSKGKTSYFRGVGSKRRALEALR
jgi:hypothetical protein